jgi:DNA polymerase sigma
LIQKCDLGKLLIGFFHLFGKEFNYDTTAINAKKQFYAKPESLISQQMQLNIEDPHDPGI